MVVSGRRNLGSISGFGRAQDRGSVGYGDIAEPVGRCRPRWHWRGVLGKRGRDKLVAVGVECCDDNGVMNHASAAGKFVIAVGHGSNGAGAIWTSPDGLSWTAETSLPGNATDFTASAASGTLIVVFGSETSGASVLLTRAL